MRAVIDADCRPPAAQGDVYRACAQRPRAIGIIDGYFHGVPSVWHKEILWAIKSGILVYGSASMGALRAAELGPFGMRGIGRIFDSYSKGEIEDDDEVAVSHAPAELGFRQLSEPMVNVRATLQEAERSGVLSSATAAVLCKGAKGIYYADRTWDVLFDRSVEDGLPGSEIEALRKWLGTGRVDLKRQDAIDMLGTMSRELKDGSAGGETGFEFEWTDMWDSFSAKWSMVAQEGGSFRSMEDRLVLDELRLRPQHFSAALERAILRVLALREAGRAKLEVENGALKDTLTKHQTGLGLFRRSELDRWLAENALDTHGYEILLAEDNLAGTVLSSLATGLHDQILHDLKYSGYYAELAARARRKIETIERHCEGDPAPVDTGLNVMELLAWYFQTRSGEPVPDNVDEYVREFLLDSRADLYRLLSGEYIYQSESPDG